MVPNAHEIGERQSPPWRKEAFQGAAHAIRMTAFRIGVFHKSSATAPLRRVLGQAVGRFRAYPHHDEARSLPQDPATHSPPNLVPDIHGLAHQAILPKLDRKASHTALRPLRCLTRFASRGNFRLVLNRLRNAGVKLVACPRLQFPPWPTHHPPRPPRPPRPHPPKRPRALSPAP